MKTISVCIPTYEMGGRGAEFLRHSFDMLARQTFKDFDVVISDHSKDDLIESLCKEYSVRLDIHYFKNTERRGNSSANMNNAMRHAGGRLMKFLFQDDFLYHEKSLEDIAAAFGAKNSGWLAAASTHTEDGTTFYRPIRPRYDDATALMRNTISSPSAVTVSNDNPPLFDENLLWWMDLDYYKRCYERYGMPIVIDDINVVNRIGEHQMTATVTTEKLKADEFRYILKKYKMKNAGTLMVAYTFKRCERATKGMLKKMLGIKTS